MNRRYCMTLDLKDDPKLIAQYKKCHESIWPEVAASMEQAGAVDMEIYLQGTRMFMIMEVNDKFSFEKKQKIDSESPRVREWEELIWKFQQSLPQAKAGEKWLLMERIFKLAS